MTTRERVGQLFMMGVAATGPYRSEIRDLVAGSDGNVYLRGDTTAGRHSVRRIVTDLAPRFDRSQQMLTTDLAPRFDGPTRRRVSQTHE